MLVVKVTSSAQGHQPRLKAFQADINKVGGSGLSEILGVYLNENMNRNTNKLCFIVL
jgi:hypothetical protein